MTKKELQAFKKAVKKQIADIREEKKNHLMQARICTYNINKLRQRLAELDRDLKKAR